MRLEGWVESSTPLPTYEGMDVRMVHLRYWGCTGLYTAAFTFYADIARKAASFYVGDKVCIFFDIEAIKGKMYNHIKARNIELCVE